MRRNILNGVNHHSELELHKFASLPSKEIKTMNTQLPSSTNLSCLSFPHAEMRTYVPEDASEEEIRIHQYFDRMGIN